MKCDFCNSKVENISSHKRNCNKYLTFKEMLTKEYLEDLYLNKKMSIIDITNFLNLKNHDVIYRLLKKYNITIRNFSDACKNGSRKREETNIKKTGFKHNFCKNSPSRLKWEKRLIEEEGITNVFQRESVKQKSVETFIRKYNKENPGLLTTHRGKNVYSKIHRFVVDFLQSYKIDASIEYKILNNNNRYYSYDIIINNTNKIIEVFGDYWHGNPLLYKAKDIILKNSSKEIVVEDKWKFDDKKINFAKSKGYSVLIVWEYDLKNNKEQTLANILDYCNN